MRPAPFGADTVGLVERSSELDVSGGSDGALTWQTRRILSGMEQESRAMAEVRRRLSVAGTTFVYDHENLAPNESGSGEEAAEAVITNAMPQEVVTFATGAGDEIRVEVRIIAQARDNGDIMVNGTAMMFEGDDENTTDLDGQQVFAVLVPRDSFATQRVRVVNSDEGGDEAMVDLAFRNDAID